MKRILWIGFAVCALVTGSAVAVGRRLMGC